MRFTWRGNWKKGEIIIEAETLEELDAVLNKVSSLSKIEDPIEMKSEEFPKIPDGLGCSEAIRELLQTDWGRQPRSMNEITEALETNALYFSKGTLSGTLTMMTKGGHLRRFKKAGRWTYVIK
jgi:hypothetical protein